MNEQIKLVKDWGTFTVPELHEARVNELLKSMKDVEAHLDTDWKKCVDKPGMQVYYPTSPDVKVLSCYAKATLDCSAQVALEVLNDENLLKEMDPNVDKLTVLERDHHNRFTHVLMKSIFYTAPREVVTMDHWRVDEESGAVLKAAFSVEREEVPEHPDPSVRIRALTDAWTLIMPDPVHDTKCEVSFLVNIDVRLEHVPQWVLKMVAGSAQKVNAKDFATNLKLVNKLAIKKQKSRPVSHVITNEGGKADPIPPKNAGRAREVVDKSQDFSDLKAHDVAVPVLLVLLYIVALFVRSRHVDLLLL